MLHCCTLPNFFKEMDDESNINKEFVKQLFSINVESDASKALCVDSFNQQVNNVFKVKSYAFIVNSAFVHYRSFL